MSRVKNYLTTGEAAIFDVYPDIIQMWIKSGGIPAISTSSIRFTIHIREFLTKTLQDKSYTRSVLSFSCEFCSDSVIIDDCKQCISYKSRASLCYIFRIILLQTIKFFVIFRHL